MNYAEQEKKKEAEKSLIKRKNKESLSG